MNNWLNSPYRVRTDVKKRVVEVKTTAFQFTRKMLVLGVKQNCASVLPQMKVATADHHLFLLNAVGLLVVFFFKYQGKIYLIFSGVFWNFCESNWAIEIGTLQVWRSSKSKTWKQARIHLRRPGSPSKKKPFAMKTERSIR